MTDKKIKITRDEAVEIMIESLEELEEREILELLQAMMYDDLIKKSKEELSEMLSSTDISEFEVVETDTNASEIGDDEQ